MKAFILLIVFAFCMTHVALADTYCGSVSTGIQILEPTITGSPTPITLASYDINTKGLSVQFAQNRADYFVGVPNQLIIGHATVPWVSISHYPQALVQDRSTCPVLASNGQPIITMGNAAVTTSPFVASPCPADTHADMLQVVALIQAPLSIYRSIYDKTLQWLFVQFVDGESSMFVGVPQGAVNGTVMWNDLSIYGAAIMAQGGTTTCPLLAQP